MTGNVIFDLQITDQQPLLNYLFGRMRKYKPKPLVEHPEIITDQQLLSMAYGAANAEKFIQLYQFGWKSAEVYESPSEADFALLSLLSFYTKSNSQVRRLFYMSALGQREKAYRVGYVDRAISKLRSNEPEPMDPGVIKAIMQNVASRQKGG